MGKKDGSAKKRKLESEERLEDEEITENVLADPELQAELAAVMAIRAEKQQQQQQEPGKKRVKLNPEEEKEEKEGGIAGKPTEFYNRDALLKCLEDLETADLPFIQTMEISEFEFPQTNELDDMEREV